MRGDGNPLGWVMAGVKYKGLEQYAAQSGKSVRRDRLAAELDCHCGKYW